MSASRRPPPRFYVVCGLVCACLAARARRRKVSGRTWQGLLAELVLLIGMITRMIGEAPLGLHPRHFCKDRLQMSLDDLSLS